ncbi:serine/threonine-protein kinase [Streptomyces sp. NPDC059698]|uniref:serine/threonine-protein kinase n=1 Tax=unclassified Streptomyces TaxID=2593676 RepID=UPI00093CA34D|nr:serine/threonine-protein kinase [Streptomyces sp. CB02366]OKJ34850.1 serine/threonine protein kinase [Streptomyces sp. CB02366]
MSLRGGDPAEIGGYPLEERLGSGGMGTVFLARTSSGRPVAIKLIHQHFAGDDEFRIRFRQEVAAARRVSGAFTAAVVDAAPEAEQPWMATTYIEGPTLAQRIAEGGPLGGAELRRLAIGLAEALRDIHRVGVVHRDLKPSNVVLSPEGPRVIDFGISRAADQETLTMTGRVIGTPPFMSPEQLRAPRGVGPRSDVFSLGTLLVYAATGRGPFDADSPYMTAYQVVHEEPSLDAVPPALRAVVEPCLGKEPEGRPSADELLVLLRDLPADGLGGADPASGGPGAGRTRDVITQHHLATPATPSPATAPAAALKPSDPAPAAPASAPPAPSEAGSTGASVGGRLRSRWRPVLAAAVAVAAIGGGVAALTTGGGDRDGGGDPGPAVPGGALPAGFEPWRTTVLGGREDIPDELRCVTRAEALFCGGGGVVASRVDPGDGTQVWTVKSPGVPTQGMHLVGATDDTVVGYRIADQDAPQGPPEEVVALDADSGEELWSTPSGAQSTAVTGRTRDAVVAGSAVVTVDPSNSRFEARDARGGKVAWTAPFPGGTQCAPVAEGTRLLAMCATDAEVDGLGPRRPTLRTLDPGSGELGAAVEVEGPVEPVGEAGGSLVLLSPHYEGTARTGYDGLARFDPASGKVTYSRLDEVYDGTPGMADGTVYLSGRTGLVTAFDSATGRKKWVRQTGVEGASGPAAGDGAVYFSSATGRVVALSPNDGKTLWATDPQADGLTGQEGASPRVTVAGRAVFVAAAENTLFAFDAGNPPRPR